MSTNHSPRVANLLRHWAVAGVAALMAVAWVAISLVVPSMAEPGNGAAQGAAKTLDLKLYDPAAVYMANSGGHTQGEPAEVNTVHTLVDPRHPRLNAGIEAMDHHVVSTVDLTQKTDFVTGFKHLGTAIKEWINPSLSGLITYSDGTKSVCFNPTVNGNNSAGTAWIFAKPTVAPARHPFSPDWFSKPVQRSFRPAVEQQRLGRVLSYIYSAYPSKFSIEAYQRVAWRIVSDSFRLKNTNDQEEAREKAEADRLYNEVLAKVKNFDTNANLLKSLKVQITPAGNQQQSVRIVGSAEAKRALLEAHNADTALTVNGQPVPVKQALTDQGYLVTVPCVNGRTQVHAEFNGHIKLSGLYIYTYAPDRSPWYGQDQVRLVLGSREVTVKGSASVDVSCNVPPATTTTTSTHTVPPSSTTSTHPPTPSTTTVTPITPTPTTPKTTTTTSTPTPTTVTPTPTTVTPTPTKVTPTPTTPSTTTTTTTPTPTTPKTTTTTSTPTPTTVTPTPTTITPTPTIPSVTPTPAPVPPSIGTTATNGADGSKSVTEGVAATVKDTVAVRNFAPGVYTLVGKLVDDQGRTVEGATAHPVSFTVKAGEKSKSVEMLFSVPASAVRGSKLVAFEKVYRGDVTASVGSYDKPNLPGGPVVPVATHENRNDHGQTVSVRKPPTTGFSVAKRPVKSVAGLVLPKAFGFDYFCGDHAPQAGDWQSLGSLTAGGEAKRVSGVRVGATCYVRESNAVVEHARLLTSWMVDGVAVSDDASLVKDSAGNAVGVRFTARQGVEPKVAATNVYKPVGGHLSLAKKLVDTTADKVAPASVKLRYVCATGAGSDSLVAQGVKTVAANAAAVTVGEVLPVGARCVVSEEAAPVPAGSSFVTGWDVDGSPVKPGDVTWGGVKLAKAVKTGPVHPGGTVSVVASNTYADNRAGFTLVKRVSSSDERAKTAAFRFDYSCRTGEAAPVAGEFTLRDGQTFASSSVKALDGLRKGSVCRIREEKPAAISKLDFAGVTFDQVGSSDASFSVDPKDKNTLVVKLGVDKAPAGFRATNLFQPPVNVPSPKIGTVLAGPGGVKTVDLAKVGESVSLVDTVHFEGLVAGSKYYLEGSLVDRAGKPVGVSAVKAFTPAGKAGDVVSGDVGMSFDVPRGVLEANSSLVAFEKVWAEGSVKDVKPGSPGSLSPKSATDRPTARHENPDSPAQTVAVKLPPKPGPKARIVLSKRVDAPGLQVPAGREYAFNVTCGDKGQAGFVSRDVRVAAGRQVGLDVAAGLRCRVSEAADSVAGVASRVSFTVDGVAGSDVAVKRGVEFVVPVNGDGRVAVTATNEYLRPVVPRVGTTATNRLDGSKTLGYGHDASIRDVVSWSGLPAGDYVLVASLVKNVDGRAVPVAQASAAHVPFTVGPGVKSGEQVVLVSVPGKLVVPDSKFVVFERVYRAVDVDQSEGVKHGAVPVATHEDVTDAGQSVIVDHEKPVHPELVIGKEVQGMGVPVGHDFVFGIECVNSDGDKGLVTDVRVQAGQHSDPVALKTGARCTVVEKSGAALLNGVVPQKVSWVASQGVDLAAGEDQYTRVFTVPGVDGVLRVEATNVYVPPVSTPPSTPPCTPGTSTPGKPGTPGTPGKPGTPGTHGTPGKPGTPSRPECPPTVTTTSTVTTTTTATSTHPPVTTTVTRTSTVPPVTSTTTVTKTSTAPPVTSTVTTTPPVSTVTVTPPTVTTTKTVTTPGASMPGKPSVATPVSTPPCTTPATPGQPGSGTPGQPGTHGTPGRPGTPVTPECPPVRVPPCTTPATPGQPGVGTPATPGQPGQPGQPGKPGVGGSTPPECVPAGPAPRLQTVATDSDGLGHVIAAGVEGIVADTVYWSGLPVGDYTLVGTLMDKATGTPVAGATMVTPMSVHVEAGMKSGSVVMLFSVPAASAKPGAQFVAFERLYKFEDVDLLGRARVRNGLVARSVAEHTDIRDKAQTVSVRSGVPVPHRPLTSRPPVVPAALVPAGPVGSVVALPPLAKTGVATGALAVLAGGVLLVGAGIARLRQRQRQG